MKQTLWQKIKIFLEMIKFEHSIFALPFAYLGMVMAEEGWPRTFVFAWGTVAMVSFRTMGMALNRIIDARIDAQNPRTQQRAIPAGALKVPFVWTAAAVSLLIFEYSAYQLGPLCFKLTPVPISLTVLYPFLKRFTWFSHLILGMILAIAPYGTWLASRGEFSWIPGMISIGVMTWVCGFDIIYALQDVDFDRKAGLYSFPSRFSVPSALFLTKILHGVTLIAWIAAGQLAGLGWVYQAGMALVAVFLIREHWLIHSAGIHKINEAFFWMNAVTSISVLIAVILSYLVRGNIG